VGANRSNPKTFEVSPISPSLRLPQAPSTSSSITACGLLGTHALVPVNTPSLQKEKSGQDATTSLMNQGLRMGWGTANVDGNADQLPLMPPKSLWHVKPASSKKPAVSNASLSQWVKIGTQVTMGQ
jgi:hypothetical protein